MGKKTKELLQKIKKLRNLKQYKNLSEKELEKIALKQLKEEKDKKISAYINNNVFLFDEQEKANEKLEQYKQAYHLNSLSELDQLKKLVYLEVLYERIQKNLNSAYLDDNNKAVASLTKMLLDINTAIGQLKKELGILEVKKDNSSFEYIQKLKKKFKVWREEHQASRQVICPHCSKMILLKIRTEAWEVQKHPYFKDRILYNEHLLRLYLAGILTAEDIGLILGITKEKDYLSWLIDRWISRPDFKKIEKEAKEIKKNRRKSKHLVDSDDRKNK